MFKCSMRRDLPRSVLLFVCGFLIASCVVHARPLEVPETRKAVLLLVSTEMPAPIDTIARHAWFAMRGEGEARFRRVEYGDFGHGPFTGISDERLHAVWLGEEAEQAIACLAAHAHNYEQPIDRRYLAWPGPNSNTFVDQLLRRCGLTVDLPATAIGKDYRGVMGASRTSGGTGIQLETPLLGMRVGLKEGIELHLFGFALGIDFWPPALIVPLGPGRFGFEDR